jgi:hypothetical protein
MEIVELGCRMTPRSAASDWAASGLGFGGRVAFGLAIDVGDGERPQRDEVDAGDQLAGEGGQELPVPAEQEVEDASHDDVDPVSQRRLGALDASASSANASAARNLVATERPVSGTRVSGGNTSGSGARWTSGWASSCTSPLYRIGWHKCAPVNVDPQ